MGSDNATNKYFHVTFWSLLIICILGLIALSPFYLIPVGDRSEFFSPGLTDPLKILWFIFVLAFAVCFIIAGFWQVVMFQNPIYHRSEREWQDLTTLGGHGTAIIFILWPLWPVCLFIWYWDLTRACVAIATTCESSTLLAHARRAKSNSVILLVDLILLPIIYWMARYDPNAQYLIILNWLLVSFCVYALFQLLILLHYASKSFKDDSN